MIVAFQPGGSVKDVRVVLRTEELIPNRFNTSEAIIYRENPSSPGWILVKPKFTVLPPDSPLLSQPKLPDSIFPLTTEPEGATFEHQDIIRLDEEPNDRHECDYNCQTCKPEPSSFE